jgi:RNA polymerase sigma-70 factor, ECF subfamily
MDQMTRASGESNVMNNTVAANDVPAMWTLPLPDEQSRLSESELGSKRMVRRDFTSADFEAEAMPHLNDLYRTASRILRDTSRAEDVVQEVYLQAWKSFDRFEPGTNCKAWLFKILFHSINHYRRKWFRLRLLGDKEEHLEENLSWTPPLPDHLTDAEILRALESIPHDFRAVVLLVDIEEFAYKEAADILNVPIGTVMSRLSRGRKLLREQLLEVAQSYGIVKPAAKGTN